MKMTYIKNIAMIFTLSLCLVFSSYAAEKDNSFSSVPYKSATWKSVTEIVGAEGTQRISHDVYYKSGKMRTEGIITNPQTGKKIKQITIINENNMYLLFPDEMTGMKYPFKSDTNPEYQNKKSEKHRKKATKIGSETISGVSCNIYKYLLPENDSIVKEWRNKTDGFVMKSSIKSEGTTNITTISNLKKNAKISDLLFTPSNKYKISDVENLMKSFQKSTTNSTEMQDSMKEMMKSFPGQ